jgi:hypothetical protein
MEASIAPLDVLLEKTANKPHMGWNRLAEAGCDAFTIAQLLGHSDVLGDNALCEAIEGYQTSDC